MADDDLEQDRSLSRSGLSQTLTTEDQDDDPFSHRAERPSTSSQPPRITLADNTGDSSTAEPFEPVQSWGVTSIDRNRRRVKNVRESLRRPFTRTQAALDPTNAHLDVLYESQRGCYVFGKPLYSARAMFPREAAPWADEQCRPSLVDITNAQLPDPSWQWVWRTWYVDMSRDVDEEGWEYSFFFRGFAWHGISPWFHSFVRRRRWIRLRRRREEGLDAVFEDEGVFEDEPLEMGDPSLKKKEKRKSKKKRARMSEEGG
jgi:hypothetical protein